MPHVRPLTLAALCLTLLSAANAAAADADGDGVPDPAEALLATDPQTADTDGDGLNDLADPEPTSVANPIASSATSQGFEIVSVKVEDNYDRAAGKDAPDHLEFELRNLATTEVTGFELYYTITEAATGKAESYYRKLDGLVLSAGGSGALHVDSGEQPGHFRANPNSVLYRTPNGKTVTVELVAVGFAPVRAEVNKDEGAEEAD